MTRQRKVRVKAKRGNRKTLRKETNKIDKRKDEKTRTDWKKKKDYIKTSDY